MKSLSRVVWSEGMHLGPHHFQAQSRYFEDSVRFAMEHAWFEPWGLSMSHLDEHAIQNGHVALLRAHGIFADGLAFEMPESDPLPEERHLSELFSEFSESSENILIFLAIPKRQHAERNCDVDGVSNGARYRSVKRLIRDANNGTDEKEIGLGQKSIRIITENEVRDDLVTMPLASVRRNGSGDLIYDSAFVPPCTRLTASPWLMAFLSQLIEVLEAKRSVLLSPRYKDGQFQAGISQLEVSKFWFLHTISDGLAILRHLYISKRGHPEELFRELSRIAGALCTFNVTSDPGTLPAYDHRQLGPCFSALGQHIREHLEILLPSNTLEIPVSPSQPNLHTGQVTDQRCFGRSRWILGIGSSAGEAEVLTKVPYLVKVCSSRFVGELVRRAMPGLSLVHLPVAPSAISPEVDLQYFAISKSGACWNHIMESREVGIYVPNELPNPVMKLQVVLEN